MGPTTDLRLDLKNKKETHPEVVKRRLHKPHFYKCPGLLVIVVTFTKNNSVFLLRLNINTLIFSHTFRK